jgi:hypothetical protein
VLKSSHFHMADTAIKIKWNLAIPIPGLSNLHLLSVQLTPVFHVFRVDTAYSIIPFVNHLLSRSKFLSAIQIDSGDHSATCFRRTRKITAFLHHSIEFGRLIIRGSSDYINPVLFSQPHIPPAAFRPWIRSIFEWIPLWSYRKGYSPATSGAGHDATFL